MSTIRSTSATPATTTASAGKSKKAAAPAAAATRLNTDPPALDIRSLNNDLSLTQAQRERIRTLLTADGRKQSQISHMHWSTPATRRANLWQARDAAVKEIQHALDPKQLDKLKTLLGPSA